MKIFAIESSCDETAAAVVEDGRKVLSNVVNTQLQEHRKFGGVVPEIASRRHTENILSVAHQAFSEAGVTMKEIDGVAVTYAPGLIGALLVGVNFAKGLCMALHKPLVPVHHLRSHVAANYLCHPDLKPPFLSLVVSGGHSHIVEVQDYTTFRILGKTRDDAAGEAFDKAARSMGYPYPGGVFIDRQRKKEIPNAFVLPRPKLSPVKLPNGQEKGSDLDFSFSGLKTAVINLLHHAQQKGCLDELNREDLAASFQYTVADILTSHFLEAAQRTGYKTLVLAGGVSANSGLRALCMQRCQDAGYQLFIPELRFCGDNAAMVGAQGFYEYQRLSSLGRFAGSDLNAAATLSIEENYNPVQ